MAKKRQSNTELISIPAGFLRLVFSSNRRLFDENNDVLIGLGAFRYEVLEIILDEERFNDGSGEWDGFGNDK